MTQTAYMLVVLLVFHHIWCHLPTHGRTITTIEYRQKQQRNRAGENKVQQYTALLQPFQNGSHCLSYKMHSATVFSKCSFLRLSYIRFGDLYD